MPVEAPKPEQKVDKKEVTKDSKLPVPKAEAEVKKEQGNELGDDHKLAVKHTVALIKAQKLH